MPSMSKHQGAAAITAAALADAIKAELDAAHLLPEPRATAEHRTLYAIAHRLGECFWLDRPRFDRSNFLQSCGFGVRE